MPNRKPLIIRGARQTGKTWLMREFGKKAFKKMVYVNFENEPRFRDLFIKDYNTARIISMLELHLTSLKYFCEEAPQYAIVAAGSLLGISLHANQSFPVGKVDFLDLYPMSLEEFMCAAGKKMLWDAMVAQEWDMVATFHDELLQMLRIYMYVGGMPEVVKQWVDNQDFFAVREKQQNILRSYVADFSKHIPDDQVPRVNMVWDSLPAQLAKENKKFIYGIIRDGARAKDFELAIMWLYNCGLVLKSHRVKVPSMPLKAYQDFQTFKLFMVDVGLLGAAVGLQTQMLLEGNRLFTEFKGALAEQYVMQELSAQNFDYIGYWTNERSTAEVDFVIQQKGEVVPIEVKSGENLRSRSFTQFCRTYEPKIAFKASTLPYHGGMEIVNVPLYGIIPALSAGQ